MTIEEFDKLIEKTSVIKPTDPLSYYSFNVEDMREIVKKYKKIPSVNDLLKENKRLNNIINELEKVIHYELLEIRKNNDYNLGLRNMQHVLKRLQELKEGK